MFFECCKIHLKELPLEDLNIGVSENGDCNACCCKESCRDIIADIVFSAHMSISNEQQYGEQDHPDAVFEKYSVELLHVVIYNRTGDIRLIYIVRITHRVV